MKLSTATWSPRYLAGTAAMVLILATSRWGTNIGVMPLFITDVLLGLAIVQFLLSLNKTHSFGLRRVVWPGLWFTLFFGYAVVRVVFSIGQASVADWARDSAPFLYAGVALLSAAAFAYSTPESRQATYVVLWRALIVHLVWVGIAINVLGGGGLAVSVPFFRVQPFALRLDYDGALIGVLAAMALWRILTTSQKRGWPMLILGASLVIAALMQSRAALISTIVVLVLVYGFAFTFNRGARTRHVLMVGAIPILLMGAVVGMLATTPGQRLLATFNPSLAQSSAQLNAVGTATARSTAWEQVIAWTNETTLRMMFGGGFGNDFLTQSGAVVVISGTDYEGVRSPHNYFVGAYARLGIIGTVLSIMLIAHILVTIVRRRSQIIQEPFLMLCAVTAVAMLPIATLGVILESPFGAIPFYWCAGIILALRRVAPTADSQAHSPARPRERRQARRGTLASSSRTR